MHAATVCKYGIWHMAYGSQMLQHPTSCCTALHVCFSQIAAVSIMLDQNKAKCGLKVLGATVQHVICKYACLHEEPMGCIIYDRDTM